MLLSLLDLLPEADGSDDDLGDTVGVAVGGRSAILEVSITFLGAITGDTDTAATVSYT